MNNISSQSSTSIIPLPAKLEQQVGQFALTAQTAIITDASNTWNAAYLRNLLHKASGIPLPITIDDAPTRPLIRLIAGVEPELGKEGYRLSVSEREIKLEGSTASGVFYAIQSLRQLLSAEIESDVVLEGRSWSMPCVTIEDRPRFGWRGHMLDVGRHFHDKATILRTLDLMALHKLNVFHWHLTEDQGWRIESKRYPRLTEVGSMRPGTKFGLLGKHDGVPHGGFYTQAEIREVVEYAAQRNILVVPEIEIPGHALAALTAYPELSCRSIAPGLATGPGIFRDIFCAGKEATFDFLSNLLDEMIELFPSPYIHIGGDEAPKARWKSCPNCQWRMQEEKLATPHELQSYFTNRIVVHLAKRGKRAIVWNDALNEKLDPSVIVQYWVRNRKGVAEAAKQGRDVINSSHWHLYINQSYAFSSLSNVYNFEPLFPELGDDASHLLGLEAPLWTEWVPNRARLDYQVHPRLSAVAEIGWTQKSRRNYSSFQQRLQSMLQRLDRLDVRYAPLSEVDPGWLKQKVGKVDMFRVQRGVAIGKKS
ncbi:MAG: beta-N-acetylhexosaminidase [Caldilineaceae bacterium]